MCFCSQKPAETLLEEIPTTVNIKLPEESVKDTQSVKLSTEDTKDSLIHEEKHEEKSKKSPRKTTRKSTGKSQGKSSRSGKTSVTDDGKKRKEDKAERGEVETPGEQVTILRLHPCKKWYWPETYILTEGSRLC